MSPLFLSWCRIKNATRGFLFLTICSIIFSSSTTGDRSYPKGPDEIDNCVPLPNSRVRCYEPLTAKVLTWKRTRRGAIEQNANILFFAFGQHFELELKKDRRVLKTDMKVEIVDGNALPSKYPIERGDFQFFSGFVKGEKSSFAEGWINTQHQTFDGSVILEHEQYVIEPRYKYFDAETDMMRDFHFRSIIYRAKDLVLNSSEPNTCASIQPKGNGKTANPTRINKESVQKWRRSILDFNPMKRFAPKKEIKAKLCTLHIVVDHNFFQLYGLGNVAFTIKEVVMFVANADHIFRSTVFSKDQSYEMGLVIKKITIHKNDHSSRYLFKGPRALNPDYYLADLSRMENFEDYCLGIGYTYTDFDHGLVGLAYLGGTTEKYGGICLQKRASNAENDRKRQNFNTGFISLLNYGTRVTRLMGSVTTAHEIGHAFGTDHDPNILGTPCAPGGNAGNFIMFYIAGTGLFPNHRIFSKCSLISMWPVIKARSSCFVDETYSECGNGVVEEGEECDCGPRQLCDAIDHCCVPSDIRSKILRPCTLKSHKGYTCTPMASVCCETSTCQPISSANSVTCEIETDCKKGSHCNGVSEQCPKVEFQEDGYPCAYGAQSCTNGTCAESTCKTVGLQPCLCEGFETNLCKLCCKDPYMQGPCKPYKSRLGEEVLFTHGELCDRGSGICMVGNICHRNRYRPGVQFLKLFTADGSARIMELLKQHGVTILFGVLCLFVSVIVFNVVYSKPHVDVRALAYRTGNMARIWNESQRQGTHVRRKLRVVSSINFDHYEKSMKRAVVRMKALFPTVSQERLQTMIKTSSNEEYMVKKVLAQGYPMRRYYLDEPLNTETTATTEPSATTDSSIDDNESSSDEWETDSDTNSGRSSRSSGNLSARSSDTSVASTNLSSVASLQLIDVEV